MCNRLLVGVDNVPCHVVSSEYLDPIREFSGVAVMVIPAMYDEDQLAAVVGAVDGIVLTGAPSMVAPEFYSGAALEAEMHTDIWRDRTALSLVTLALQRCIPLLGICRGLQEINVALGGTLATDATGTHAAPPGSRGDRYLPRHEVTLVRGGVLARVAEAAELPATLPVAVNSLHRQKIDRSAPRLSPEAHAADGTIEAGSVPEARFAVAVQWHPEWYTRDSRLNAGIFAAFGDACMQACLSSRASGMVIPQRVQR